MMQLIVACRRSSGVAGPPGEQLDAVGRPPHAVQDELGHWVSSWRKGSTMLSRTVWRK